VNEKKEVKLDGILVTELALSGDKTIAPRRHQMRFVGECPCDANGTPINAIRPNLDKQRISAELSTDYEFSNKPSTGYPDHFVKVMNYAAIISGPASTIDPSATPMTHNVVEPEPDESPFNYLDTASAGADISIIAKKLAIEEVAIVGLGGTGAYILDLIAKTPIKRIHLYDGDKFSSHNAFRAPGAASVEKLREQNSKVAYFSEIYSKLHRGIVAHPEYIDASNVSQLTGMSCVFLSLDAGPGKRLIVETLKETNVPFIDAAMGLYSKNETLGGILQVTTSTPENRTQASARMSLSDADEPNEYDKNIQVADLNALNATLAVLRWKKMMGFYFDSKNSNFQTFTIRGSLLLNEDGNDTDK
tara:strand:- start:128 stop:1210 length:1083 start_codon:yes stop_codon:yes gene_type:complete